MESTIVVIIVVILIMSYSMLQESQRGHRSTAVEEPSRKDFVVAAKIAN